MSDHDLPDSPARRGAQRESVPDRDRRRRLQRAARLGSHAHPGPRLDLRHRADGEGARRRRGAAAHVARRRGPRGQAAGARRQAHRGARLPEPGLVRRLRPHRALRAADAHPRLCLLGPCRAARRAGRARGCARPQRAGDHAPPHGRARRCSASSGCGCAVDRSRHAPAGSPWRQPCCRSSSSMPSCSRPHRRRARSPRSGRIPTAACASTGSRTRSRRCSSCRGSSALRCSGRASCPSSEPSSSSSSARAAWARTAAASSSSERASFSSGYGCAGSRSLHATSRWRQERRSRSGSSSSASTRRSEARATSAARSVTGRATWPGSSRTAGACRSTASSPPGTRR